MNRKKTAALLAAIMLLTGCSGNNGSTGDSAGSSSVTSEAAGGTAEETRDAAETAETGSEDAAATVLAEGYAQPETPIAVSAKEGAAPITFGDFLKEYKYYMASCGLSEDTTEGYAETLRQRREYIVNYLINGKILSDKFAEYFPEGFTEEEEAQITADYEAGVNQMLASLGSSLALMQDSELTEAEISALAEEGFQQLMDNCGLTREDFYNWQRESAVQQKIAELLTADVTVDPAEAEAQYNAAAQAAKESYESDPASYDADSNSLFYIPEGARYVKHILLKLSDEDVQAIFSLRAEGKDEEADAMRSEKLAALDEKLAEVQERVAAGEDFDGLMAEYSGDGDVTMEYLVVPGTGRYMEGFAECALGIAETGGTDTCFTDYGYHVIKYTRDAVISDEARSEAIATVTQYLTEAYKSQSFNTSVREWRQEYNYEIDRDLLLLGAEEE